MLRRDLTEIGGMEENKNNLWLEPNHSNPVKIGYRSHIDGRPS